MEKRHYNTIFSIKWEQEYYWMILLVQEHDSFVTDNEQQLLLFTSPEGLEQFAAQESILIEEDSPFELDLDELKMWLRQPDNEIESEFFLDTWNFFTDASEATQKIFSGDETTPTLDAIYDKLYFATHDPAQLEENPPTWSVDEILRIQEIFKDGIRLFENNAAKYRFAN